MKCKICNNVINTIIDDNLGKVYKICPSCQLIALEKSYFVDEIREKIQYENHNNSFESKGYVEMFENFLDYFWDDLKKDYTDVLDFGSGPGPVLAQILQNRGLHVEIYDKFYQPNKIYENKKYDLITSTEVFEHLENPLVVLFDLKKHLKESGIIAIMTLFHNNNSKDFLNWWYRRDPTHITFYTPKTFKVMAPMCGLEILKCDDKRIVVFKNA